MHTAHRISEHDAAATISGLEAEVSRLNQELTCGSEAFYSIVSENARMKEALENAERVFSESGNSTLAAAMRFAVEGVNPHATMPSAGC